MSNIKRKSSGVGKEKSVNKLNMPTFEYVDESTSANDKLPTCLAVKDAFEKTVSNWTRVKKVEPDVQNLPCNKMIQMVDINNIIQSARVDENKESTKSLNTQDHQTHDTISQSSILPVKTITSNCERTAEVCDEIIDVDMLESDTNAKTASNIQLQIPKLGTNISNNTYVALQQPTQSGNVATNRCLLLIRKDDLNLLANQTGAGTKPVVSNSNKLQSKMVKPATNVQANTANRLVVNNLPSVYSTRNQPILLPKVNNQANTVTMLTTRNLNSIPIFGLQNAFLISVPQNMQLLTFTGATKNSTSSQPRSIEYVDLVNEEDDENQLKIDDGKMPKNIVETGVPPSDNNESVNNGRQCNKSCDTMASTCVNLRKRSGNTNSDGLSNLNRLETEEKRIRFGNKQQMQVELREQVMEKLIGNQEEVGIQKSIYVQNCIELVTEKFATVTPVNKLQEKTKLGHSSSDVIDKSSAKVKNLSTKKKELKEHSKQLVTNREKNQSSKGNYSAFKLKELSIILSKSEVEHYFKQKKSQRNRQLNLKNKYAVSKVEASLSDNLNSSLTEVPALQSNVSAIFIDENNFEMMEQLCNNEDNKDKCIYFTNTNKIITALYIDMFSSFKNALKTKKVKIIDKTVMKMPSDVKIKHERDDKQVEFCNFIKRFHRLEKHLKYSSNVVSEHNYSVNSADTTK